MESSRVQEEPLGSELSIPRPTQTLERTAQAPKILNHQKVYTTSKKKTEHARRTDSRSHILSFSSLPLDHILPTTNLHPRSRRLRIHRAELLAIQHQARLDLSIALRLGGALLLHLRLIVTPLILDHVAEKRPVQNAQDQENPEDVDHLQQSQQAESDRLRDPAFVLLRFPVEDVGADGGEFAVGEQGVEDLEVEKVAEVGPDADEGDEVGDGEGGVEVVEDFGGLGSK